MNPFICQISISSTSSVSSITLSRNLAEQFRLIPGQTITIEIGRKSSPAKVLVKNSPSSTIGLSKELSKHLFLPYTGKSMVSYSNRKLRIGPVIGILTTGFFGNSSKPFGYLSNLYKNFILSGSSYHPFMYVFTPNMIDWNKKCVNGWYYRNNRWSRITSPIPNVIYERSPNRKAESIYGIKSCIKHLKNVGNIHIFNQGFFNKWSIHQLLNNHPRTAQYIPETTLSPSISTLQNMLEKHSMVYLKPSSGSLGLGIFRITRNPKEGYFCRFNQANKNVLHRFTSIEKLINHYFGKSDRFKNYIVQQGIRLIKIKDNPVDFRVHMNKDYTGNWKVVAIGTKAAGNGCVTTHMRTGGTVIPTDDLFRHTFGNDASKMKAQLERASITIAETLEKQMGTPLGELGLDMGIDQNRNIWMFESNSKPGRHIFVHPTLKEAGRKSARCITEYSLKLSEFV